MHHHHVAAKKIRESRARSSVYLATLFLSFHYVCVAYITSSYLGEFFSDRAVGALYAIGSFATIIAFIAIPSFISRLGNRKVAVAGIILEIIATVGMASAQHFDRAWLAGFFVVQMIIGSLLAYNLDIFLEERSSNAATGTIRGRFLMISNLTFVIMPVLIGLITDWGGYQANFMLAAAFLIPLFVLVHALIDNPAKRHHPSVFVAGIRFAKDKDLRSIFGANLLLQFFYAWMTIYTPLYLSAHLGFSWKEIGLMFSIMLLPFLLFELPLGKLADRKLGEKEILVSGFFIAAISTAILSILPRSFALWTMVLFVTRIGASAIEIMVETYFFKKVGPHESEKISFFRIARPLGYIVAPAAAALAISGATAIGLPFGMTYLALAGFIALGVLPAMRLTDTK